MNACISDGQLYFAMVPARNTSNTKIFMIETVGRGPILNEIFILKQNFFYLENFHDQEYNLINKTKYFLSVLVNVPLLCFLLNYK